MPFISTKSLKPSYDVIVVGSGAGGSQSAYTLTLKGVKVLMLEAGRNYDPVRETPMFQIGRDAPLRAAGTPDKPRGFFDSAVNGGWDVPGEPYESEAENPDHRFRWWRPRMLGGRTNHWERNSFRHGPYDFKPRSRDGFGFDWPMTYEEIAPYYDKVERLVGIYGDAEGLENSPDSPPGVLLRPPAMRIGERLTKHKVAKLGIPIVPIHRAVLSTRLDAVNVPPLLHPDDPEAQRIVAESMQMRAACFWATACERGCSIRAAHQTPTVQLPPALATGNLDLLTHARARSISLDKDGRANGIHFIDTLTGTEHHVQARAVILGASALETVRILLNSRSASFPQGIGNSSGHLGRHIMNTVGRSLQGQVPLLENLPLHNEDGAGGGHVYAPWWLYREQAAGKLSFPRGYHIEFVTGRQLPNVGTGAGLEWLTGGSFGKAFKADVRRYYGSIVTFTGRGEMIPNDRTYCELDANTKDKWGVPALRIHWHWSDHELKQADHMQETFGAMIEAMGGRVRPDSWGWKTLQPVTHEVGGAIMGAQPEASVTNAFGQTWDVPNVLVADGASFCSSPDKNPTLTIMALAWRQADHLVAEMKRRAI